MLDVVQTILIVIILGIVVMRLKPHDGIKVPSKSRKVIIDTCALIDGRVLELNRSGFVPDEIIVPEFVLHELQMLADGADTHKRERARYGLDVVKELQGSDSCAVTIDKTEFERQPNDDKLVELALKLKAPLYTTDYNLNKLADIKGVRVLNVNELAQNLRPVALPGEQKRVKILQKGSNPKQGVGYLEDGTMLVVDNAAKLVGKTVPVEVTRVHQTVAGKMLFAQVIPVTAAPEPKEQTRKPVTSQQPKTDAMSRMRIRRVRPRI